MDRRTVAIYERQAAAYDRRRTPRHLDRAAALAAAVPADAVRVDLGCGPGRYTPALGTPVVALDAAGAMLGLTARAAPGALRVRADLEALPFRRGSLGGAWSRMAYQHLEAERLPVALAHLHWSLSVGAPVVLQVAAGADGAERAIDDFPGRLFTGWSRERLAMVLTGAGFALHELEPDGDTWWVRATRLLTLPDTVGPGMRLLCCGLNPAVYAAERGIGFCRPGNRFWPALVRAGLTDRRNDPLHLLAEAGIGMTDMVKRATVRSSELSRDEYAAGFARLEALVEWLRPAAVAFVGLEGWRAAVDRRAGAGWQARAIAGVPAYVLPSTSGLNGHARLEDLAAHLAAAAAGPPPG